MEALEARVPGANRAGGGLGPLLAALARPFALPALGLWASVASPLFWFETRTLLARSPLPYALCCGLAAASGLIFAAVFGFRLEFLKLQAARQGSGKEVFFALSILAAFYVMFAAPWLSCGSFSREKREGTMDLLASTALTPSEVVGGKALSGFLRAFMPLAAMLPFFAMCVELGGVSWAEIAEHYALFASAVLFVTVSGIMWSLIFRPIVLAGIINFLGSMYILLIVAVASGIIMRLAAGAGGWAWVGIASAYAVLSAGIWLLSILIYRKASRWDY